MRVSPYTWRREAIRVCNVACVPTRPAGLAAAERFVYVLASVPDARLRLEVLKIR